MMIWKTGEASPYRELFFLYDAVLRQKYKTPPYGHVVKKRQSGLHMPTGWMVFPPLRESVLLPTDILDLMAQTQTTVWLRPRSCVFTTSTRQLENYRAVRLVHHKPPVIKKGFQKGHVQRCCTGGSAQQEKRPALWHQAERPATYNGVQLCAVWGGEWEVTCRPCGDPESVRLFAFFLLGKLEMKSASLSLVLFLGFVIWSIFDLLTDLNPAAEMRQLWRPTPPLSAPLFNTSPPSSSSITCNRATGDKLSNWFSAEIPQTKFMHISMYSVSTIKHFSLTMNTDVDQCMKFMK